MIFWGALRANNENTSLCWLFSIDTALKCLGQGLKYAPFFVV